MKVGRCKASYRQLPTEVLCQSLTENLVNYCADSHSVVGRPFLKSLASPRMSSPSRRILAVHRHLSPAMNYKSPVTSHVLDTSLGRPAADVRVELQHFQDGGWVCVNTGATNSDGRVASHLVPESVSFQAGTYRMVFHTKDYFEATGVSEYFYPEVTIAFVVKDPTQHYHVPLLINPFGYSTYRGS
jgi:5-hydroxyisourate hydrolase